MFIYFVLALASTGQLYAAEAAPTESQMADVREKAQRHRQFMRAGNFDEALQVIAEGLDTKATSSRQRLSALNLEYLREILSGMRTRGKFGEHLDSAIRHKNDPEAKKFYLQQVHQYLAENPQLSGREKIRLRTRLRAALSNYKAKSGHNSNFLEREINTILGLEKRSSTGRFIDAYGGLMAIGAYHAGDAYLEMKDRDAYAESLLEKTPHDVWHGSQQKNSTFAKGARAAREGIHSAYGVLPFTSWRGYNDASKHSRGSKILAAGHLTTRVINLIHEWVYGSPELTGDESYLLGYHNRRHGPTQAAKEFASKTKFFGRMKAALRTLGVGVAPAAFAYHYDNNVHANNYTSPGLSIANTTGMINALLELCWRIYAIKKTQQIRKATQHMAQELKTTPPTQQELLEDQQAAFTFDDNLL